MTTNILQNLRQRLIAGGDAPLTAAECPPEWETILAKVPPADLPLTALALLGQYQNGQEKPVPTEALFASAPFPKLPLPTVPSQWNGHLQEILSNKSYFVPLLHFLHRRGYVIAPEFWVENPEGDTDFWSYPEIYHPWRAWFAQDRQAENTFLGSDEEINAENWDEFYPAARREALRNLRRRCPAEARELIAACFMREKAEQRIDILAVLQVNLSPDDVPFLQSLSNDRSKKIQECAKMLRAQVEEPDAETIAEQVATIKKMFTFSPENKTLRVKNKRQEHLQMIAVARLARFAEAFGVSERDIVFSWSWENNIYSYNRTFIEKIIQQTDLDILEQVIEKILTRSSYYHEISYQIGEGFRKLPAEKQQALFLKPFKEKRLSNVDVSAFLLMLAPPLKEGQITLAELKQSRLWQLLQVIKKDKNSWRLERILPAVGLFLSRDLAQELNAAREEIGREDSALWLLDLNARLTPANEGK